MTTYYITLNIYLIYNENKCCIFVLRWKQTLNHLVDVIGIMRIPTAGLLYDLNNIMWTYNSPNQKLGLFYFGGVTQR